jgi:hypothetical protein
MRFAQNPQRQVHAVLGAVFYIINSTPIPYAFRSLVTLDPPNSL